jgi:hypothetical protein
MSKEALTTGPDLPLVSTVFSVTCTLAGLSPDLVLQRAERPVVGVGAALLVGGDGQVAELVCEELDAVRIA